MNMPWGVAGLDRPRHLSCPKDAEAFLRVLAAVSPGVVRVALEVTELWSERRPYNCTRSTSACAISCRLRT
jgi:hypothetical protein